MKTFRGFLVEESEVRTKNAAVYKFSTNDGILTKDQIDEIQNILANNGIRAKVQNDDENSFMALVWVMLNKPFDLFELRETLEKIIPVGAINRGPIQMSVVEIYEPMRYDIIAETVNLNLRPTVDEGIIRSLSRHLSLRGSGVINIRYGYNFRGPALGLFRVKGLKTIVQLSPQIIPWIFILNKHIKEDRDILACQEELIDAGLEEMAKL
jgi:hypothetical protein